jgi:hypothetical protein
MGADCCGDRYECNTTVECRCGCALFYCKSCFEQHCVEIVTAKPTRLTQKTPLVDQSLEDLLEKVKALPTMTEEQRWEQKISFVYGNLSIDKAETIDRPEFEANAWKYAWRKSEERIHKLRKALRNCTLNSNVASIALEALEEDSKLR